jgi:preprotein translocase subunit SecD
MQKNLLGKTIFIVAVLLVFLYGIIGVPSGVSGTALKQAMLERIHLGLDLKGGTHLILQVQVNEAVNAQSEQTVERLREKMLEKNVTFGDISKPDPAHPERIVVSGVNADSAKNFRDIATDTAFSQFDLASGDNGSFTLTMKPSVVADTKNRAVTQAIETIRNRIDQLGVSEPIIQEHGLGEYQILVQLPGVDDPARVKDIMQSTAMLEIRQALNSNSFATEQEALAAYNGVLPANAVIMRGKDERTSNPNAANDVYYVITRTSVVGGTDINGAQPSQDQAGRPAVSFNLNIDGAKRFGKFTGSHINDYLAIVLDNRVQSVARIESEINDRGQITGSFTPERVKDLSTTLSSGALPASIKYLEERTVGPSLGADSIRHGVTAAIIGMALVMAFMLLYYHAAGINANLALVLNLVILLGFLGFSGATLTLPGIAGVILTVGMGVDSNVLIFERIREELRHGKAASAAVDQGFGRAWLTIIDTHVTTIVSAIILFLFGTGPVRGFAVTLTFGLLANLFTAVFVSRVIFDAELSRKGRGDAISI